MGKAFALTLMNKIHQKCCREPAYGKLCGVPAHVTSLMHSSCPVSGDACFNHPTDESNSTQAANLAGKKENNEMRCDAIQYFNYNVELCSDVRAYKEFHSVFLLLLRCCVRVVYCLDYYKTTHFRKLIY